MGCSRIVIMMMFGKPAFFVVASFVSVARSETRWDEWRLGHGRSYASPREAAARRRIFFENIERYESRGGAYVLDEFADWSPEEFRARSNSCAAQTKTKANT